jgi:hypothetical protein
MPTPVLSVLLNPLLPTTSLQLGMIVLDVHYPWHDFSPKKVSLPPEEVFVASSTCIRDTLHASRGTQFHVHLTRFLKVFFQTDHDNVYRINASGAKCYRLLNSGSHFERVSREQDTRKWLETVIKQDWSAYLIVGIHTVTDADIMINYTHGSEAQVSANLPVGALADAAGGLGLGANADLKMKVDLSTTYGEMAGFIMPGERVIAVEYRKLKWKWFASKSLGNASLERGNRWKIFTEPPSKAIPEAEDEVFEDVLEVVFEEEIENTGIEEDHEHVTDHDGRKELILFDA